MAKRQRRTSPTHRGKPVKRKTNWLVIGGIAFGVVVLVGLLALALRPAATVTLEQFCQNNPENCIAKGNEEARVTVVEVSDYGCSHCRDFNLQSADSIDEQYVQSGLVRWITMPYALSTQTIPAAETAYCAVEQDNFFAYHKAMFEMQSTPAALTPAGFLESAGQAGLDLETFNSCLENQDFSSRVQANLRAAAAAGVSATPTFFINGVKIAGDNPSGITAQIESQLAGGG